MSSAERDSTGGAGKICGDWMLRLTGYQINVAHALYFCHTLYELCFRHEYTPILDFVNE